MKLIAKLLAIAVISSIPPLGAKDVPIKGDPFEEGMRQAYADYRKGDSEAVTAKLRELLKLMEDKGAAKVGGILPDSLNGWKGESLKNDDLGVVGGGVAVSRNYVSGKHEITVKVTKDAPVVKQLLPLLANQDLIRLSNRKTHLIAGETAIMDGERKLQMVLDGRILLEMTGGVGTGEKDLVDLARKLDLRALAKMK
ncbi:MAG: hypothetical protein WCK77_14800 [Verrucomicrobiota bacterium]